MRMKMKLFRLSFSLRLVLIVVILVCAMQQKKIHGCDSLYYEFNNGVVESIKDTAPNGTKIARMYFKQYSDAKALFDEVRKWADEINCETTILLKTSDCPYVVVFPKMEESK